MADFPQFDPYYPPLQSGQQQFQPMDNGYWHPQLPRSPYPQPAMMPHYGPPPQQQYRPIQQPDNRQPGRPHEQLYSPVKTTTTADANNDDDIVFLLLPMDYRPCPHTVIVVGNHNNNNTQSHHAGNVRFQQLVQREMGAYRAAETENKTTVIRRVLTELQYAFVQQDVATCRWYRVPDAAQRDLVELVFQNAIKDNENSSTLHQVVVQEQETGCVQEQEQETERGGGDETSTDTQELSKSPSSMTTSTSSTVPVEVTKKAPLAIQNMCDGTLATTAFTPLGGSQPTIITQDVPSTVTATTTHNTTTKAEDKAASAIISPEAPIVVIKNNPTLTKAQRAIQKMCDGTYLATAAFTPLGGSQPTIIQDVPSTVTASSTNETITKAEDKAASAISPEPPIVVIKANPTLTKAQRAIKNMCDGTSVFATTAETPRGRRTSKPVIHYTPEESYTVTASTSSTNETITIASPEPPVDPLIKADLTLTKAQRAIKNMCDGTSVFAMMAETPRGRRESKPVIHYTPEESSTIAASSTNETATITSPDPPIDPLIRAGLLLTTKAQRAIKNMCDGTTVLAMMAETPCGRRESKPVIQYTPETPRPSSRNHSNKKKANNKRPRDHVTRKTLYGSNDNHSKKVKVAKKATSREWVYKENQHRKSFDKAVRIIETSIDPTKIHAAAHEWLAAKGVPFDENTILACDKALTTHHANGALGIFLLNSMTNLGVGRREYCKLLLDCGFVGMISRFLQDTAPDDDAAMECGLRCLSTILASSQQQQAGGNLSDVTMAIEPVLDAMSDDSYHANTTTLACLALYNLLVADPTACARALVEQHWLKTALDALSSALSLHPSSLIVASSALSALSHITMALDEDRLRKVIAVETNLIDLASSTLLQFGGMTVADCVEQLQQEQSDVDHTHVQEDRECLLNNGFRALYNISLVSHHGRKQILEGSFHGLLEIALMEKTNVNVQEVFFALVHANATNDPDSVILEGRTEGILDITLRALELHKQVPLVVDWALEVLATCFSAQVAVRASEDDGQFFQPVMNLLDLYMTKLVAANEPEEKEDCLNVVCAALKAVETQIRACPSNAGFLLVRGGIFKIFKALKVSATPPLFSVVADATAASVDAQEHACNLILSLLDGNHALASLLLNRADMMKHMTKIANCNNKVVQQKSEAVLKALFEMDGKVLYQKVLEAHHDLRLLDIDSNRALQLLEELKQSNSRGCP